MAYGSYAYAGAKARGFAPTNGGFDAARSRIPVPGPGGWIRGRDGGVTSQTPGDFSSFGVGGGAAYGAIGGGLAGGFGPKLPYQPTAQDYAAAALQGSQAHYAGARSLQQQIIDQAQGRLNPQSPYLAGYDLDRGRLRTNAGYDERSLELQRQALGIDTAGIDRQMGYVDQSAAADTGELNRKSAYDQFNTRDEAIGKGARGSEGFRQDRSNIEASRAYGVDKIGRESAEEKAKLSDRRKTLDLQGKKLGIDGEKLKSELQYGLDRLGLAQSITVDELTDKLNSARMQDQIFAQQVFDRALQMTPIYQQQGMLPPGFQAASSMGAGYTYGSAGIPVSIARERK